MKLPTLNIEGVVKAYSQQDYQRTLVILLEDFGRVFRTLQQQSDFYPMPLSTFLELAIKLTEILGRIHAANVIHKDINWQHRPESEYWRCQNDWFWDCHPIQPHQSNLQKSPSSGRNPRLSVARANRADEPYARLPQRFLLAGRNNFDWTVAVSDQGHPRASSLPYCQTACSPQKWMQRFPNLFQTWFWNWWRKMRRIAMSAWGIKADLERCAQQLEEIGQIDNIQLSLQDVSEQFHIPQKTVWTRSGDWRLLAAFDRVAGSGNQENSHSKLKWCWSLVTLELANQHWCRNSTNLTAKRAFYLG